MVIEENSQSGSATAPQYALLSAYHLKPYHQTSSANKKNIRLMTALLSIEYMKLLTDIDFVVFGGVELSDTDK